ncbi:MAG: thiol peroxidase [Deltaproteobacteria bacterium]|nr:thiol peroxidase [Deltaproteobacteria bacterium]
MTEREGVVESKGEPLTLLGDEVKVGSKAAEFEVVGNDMKPVRLSDFRGKAVVLSAVPSLDTPTCDIETRRFNQEAAGLGWNVVILTVSRDLPFAQKRWCGAAGVDRVITASDYREGAFGRAYGVFIKEWALLARTVFVIDKEGMVRYVQSVKDVSTEPDYEPVLEAVRAAARQ